LEVSRFAKRMACLFGREHSGAGGGPMKVIIHTGFAYDDDDGAGDVGAQSFAE
jgi:hypothetical protein